MATVKTAATRMNEPQPTAALQGMRTLRSALDQLKSPTASAELLVLARALIEVMLYCEQALGDAAAMQRRIAELTAAEGELRSIKAQNFPARLAHSQAALELMTSAHETTVARHSHALTQIVRPPLQGAHAIHHRMFLSTSILLSVVRSHTLCSPLSLSPTRPSPSPQQRALDDLHSGNGGASSAGQLRLQLISSRQGQADAVQAAARSAAQLSEVQQALRR